MVDPCLIGVVVMLIVHALTLIAIVRSRAEWRRLADEVGRMRKGEARYG
jgi:hypothetical protein